MRRALLLLFIIFTISLQAAEGIQWRKMSGEIFKEAKAENKMVLLNLEANWCHWCHVMHDSTYSNPEVVAYINAHFIPVSADQDASPELSIRYKEYGWPATIFLNADGEDIVKRAGYIAPQWFLKLMKAIVKDPSPELPLAQTKADLNYDIDLTAKLKRVENNFDASLDYERGGFDQNQKYIAWDTYEYARFFKTTDSTQQWLNASVNGAYGLVDPVWGGVYQYSTHNDWEHLHFEKLMMVQARYLNIFLYDYLYTHNPNSLDKADQIIAYIDRFLNYDGVLYSNAQDADVIKGEHAEAFFALNEAQRLAQGIPAIDSNVFTERNAQIAASLLLYGSVKNAQVPKDRAYAIADVLLQRVASNGLYFHADKQRPVFSLKDQIAMANMLIALIKDKGEATNKYTQALDDLMVNIAKQYGLTNGSLKSFVGNIGLDALPIVEENIHMGRIFNWYAEFSKDDNFKDYAEKILVYVLQDETMKTYYNEPAVLMLAQELKQEAFHYVNLKMEEENIAYEILKAYAPFYSYLHSYAQGDLPLDKKELFEGFEVSTTLICTDRYCSPPVSTKKEAQAFFVEP
ncbi:hypothetical protein SAMN05216474_0551 [Lishizhenia tianjinensis]|uniref:Thioredoxin domain-containing protein n=1 Tax=Lishizhenia tianjinensis TaxID=477690 RepID=A0A1I6Y083_9FLAO|nr:DUF255 domain-containing protein [Lishizhenia tianjinensis]SFT43534.1 hypothetical protein SAMN05216474_0551 [Lishizhenia tianjinensis]